ncbi:MAG: DNA polymerase III subunit delta' [Candidatus Buchananbacteria bacterium]
MKHTTFNWKICGHENIVDFLGSSIANNNMSQAYLFYGQSGLGKYFMAKEFGKAVLCNDNFKPCQKCTSCQQIEKGGHFDFFELKRIADEETGKLKRDISMEQVRDLISKLKQGSLLGGHKVAIINGAQYLNINGANALLKTLEEPTLKTVIILIVDDISRIPKTVVSRCQPIKFLPVSIKKIESYLIQLGAEKDEAKILSRISNGLPGKAIDFYYNADLRNDYLKDVNNFLALISMPLSQRWKIVNEILSGNADGEIVFDNFLCLARDLLLINNSNETSASNFNFLEKESAIASQQDEKTIEKIIENIKFAKLALRQNISFKNALENLIINL